MVRPAAAGSLSIALLVASLLSPSFSSQAQTIWRTQEVSIPAALLIGLCYYLSQSAWLAGIGFFTLYRPLVGGALVGIILGAPLEGARIGAWINLAYLGFVAAGGSLPSDISLAGYLGTALALSSGLDAQTALALTVPVGMLGYLIYQVRMTADSIFVRWAERLAASGRVDGWAWCNVLVPQFLLLLLSLVPCAAAVYWGPEWLQTNLRLLPAWLMEGIAGAGALLPLVGLAYSLTYLWHGKNGAWFILGFLAAVLTGWPLLAIALGTVCAAWLLQPSAPVQMSTPSGSPLHPGLLTNVDLAKTWLNWLFFSHASYNYERMQGLGFAHSMVPVIKRLFASREDRAAAMSRHLVYYNSEPNVGAFILGATAALEERLAVEGKADANAVTALKTGLMGTISGIGDTLIQGTWIPVALMLGISLTEQLGVLGPFIYALLAAVSIWGVGAASFVAGYRGGRRSIAAWITTGRWQSILGGLQLVGSVMLGSLLARTVHIVPRLVINQGGQMAAVSDILDSLIPGVLPLVLCLGLFWLFKRGARPQWVVLLVLTLGFASRLAGVL